MFGKRFNLITISGFKIGIDLSWFFIAILLSWTLAAGYFPLKYPHLSSVAYWWMGIGGMLGLFICVILHELGHAIVARHYKLPVSQITLFVFGGVAEIQKEPATPKIEFLMAIAGPIVSFILAFLLYAITLFGISHAWPTTISGVTSYLALINLILALFNLIPAFPLDGGRVLRSILWAAKKDFGWATTISSAIGSGFGLALIFLGIFSLFMGSLISGLWFIILGWFLYRAAQSTRAQYYIGKELAGFGVERFMKRDPSCVPQNITVKNFIDDYVYHTYHHLYPVTSNGKLLGTVSLKEIKAIPQQHWDKTTVGQILVQPSSLHTIGPKTSALDALTYMQKTDTPLLLVVEGERLLGIITASDLFKLISLKLELTSS